MGTRGAADGVYWVACVPGCSNEKSCEPPYRLICFTTELHKIKMLVVFMKQIARNTKNILIFFVKRYVES